MARARDTVGNLASGRRVARGCLAGLSFAWVLLLAACGADHQTPLRVASNNWPGYWPLYLAQHDRQLDARLQELSSASEVLRAFRNHRIDVAAFTIEEFLQLLDEGNDPHIVQVIDYSNGADSVIARPPYAAVADLRGKLIGTENTAMGAYVLRRTLASGGLTENDVRIVAYDFGDHENAYVNGLVDAVVTFEPTRSRLLAAGGREVFSSASIPGEIADVLVVSGRTARERAADVRRLIASWYVAAESVTRDPRRAAESLANMTRLTGAQFEQAMNGVHLVTPEEDRALKKDKLAVTLVGLANTMREAGLLKHSFTLADMQAHITELAQP